jgi:hypothetical protein
MVHDFNQNTIKLIAKKMQESVGQVVIVIGLKSWFSLVDKTPVGNSDLWESPYKPVGYVGGQAKFSWNVNFNKPDYSTPISWGGGQPSTPSIKVGKNYESLFITSSVPYMERLEKGWSKQGKHMIKRTVGEVGLEIKQTLR